MNHDARSQQALSWLNHQNLPRFSMQLLAGDASFRRYFRVSSEKKTWVLMDAPPDKENLEPFLDVQAWLHDIGLRVPTKVALNMKQGFLLLEDFADDTWAVCRQKGIPLDVMFADALQQLHRLQAAQVPLNLPVFDVARMQQECDLYLDWYLPKVVGIVPNQEQRDAFHQGFLPSLETLASLPCVPVHLDFHSRNLMLPPSGLPLGIIDFQDAVVGSVTYDLASLLYDCYQDYPESLRFTWSSIFFEGLPQALKSAFTDVKHWHACVRLTAFQRHLKAIGIFSRLAYRDGKRQFLDEIPLTKQHINDEIKALNLPKSVTCLLAVAK
ncbi:MAG: phosphotransferase [Zetaproteobacteria bacterium]|nr:phosphotransferase [Zetaproteobacteria bacterium]